MILRPKADRSVGNSVEVVLTKEHGKELAYLTIDNPWAGDTQSGFGRECTALIDKEEARCLIDYLSKWVKR